MDPLGGTPQRQPTSPWGTQSAPISPTDNLPSPLSGPPRANLSPLAPRSPLPGQPNGHYRPQSNPSPTSPNNWGGSTSPPPSARSTAGAQQWGGPGHASSNPSPSPTRSGFTPRDAQTYSSPTRTRPREAEDDDDDEPLGQGRQQAQRHGNGNGNGGNGNRTVPIPQDAYVRIKVLGLEKNRRDVYIKFMAESNLPSYRHSTYRNISRSQSDFAKFADAISATCPQSIIPALPLVQTSAMTDEEDDRLVKAAYQKWLGRITSDPAVMKDEELRGFVEGEFGYTPNPRNKRRVPGTFHFPRGAKLPGEQDDDLTIAKASMSRLETNFLDTSRAIEKVSKARRAVAGALADNADQLSTFASTETYTPLAVGMKKLARTTKLQADILAHQSASEMVTLGDTLAYQSLNAHGAKETLGCREAIVDEHRHAAKATIAKKRAIERLKSGSSIRPEKVDEALEELDEAKRQEVLLAQRLTNISQHLQPSLRTHSRNAHEDIIASLLEHARTSLIYEKQLLKELEVLRPEIQSIKNPQAGVYYHNTTPAPSTARPSTTPSLSSSAGDRPHPARTSSVMSRGSSGGGSGATQTSPVLTRGQMNAGGRFEGNGTKSMYVGRGSPNFGGDDLPPVPGPGQGTGTGTGTQGRRSIQSMARSVVVTDDRRQRVDAKMAASMLANGF